MSAMSLSESGAEPNLTPMLDMVFQLITFFMLVINFKAASLDASVKLPVVGSARPVDTRGQEDFMVLNINDKGELRVFGAVRDLESYVATEARAARLKQAAKLAGKAEKHEVDTTVVLRADRHTQFKLLNKVMETCQKHGFHKFALKAFNREENKR